MTLPDPAKKRLSSQEINYQSKDGEVQTLSVKGVKQCLYIIAYTSMLVYPSHAKLLPNTKVQTPVQHFDSNFEFQKFWVGQTFATL